MLFLGSSLSLARPPNRNTLLAARVKLCPRQYTDTSASFHSIMLGYRNVTSLNISKCWQIINSVSFLVSLSMLSKWCEKTLTKAWTWRKTNFWRFRLQFLPLPFWCVQLVELIRILAVFHHSTKHQDACTITDKAVGSTAGWCVALRRGNKPLICSCQHKVSNTDLIQLW